MKLTKFYDASAVTRKQIEIKFDDQWKADFVLYLGGGNSNGVCSLELGVWGEFGVSFG